MRKLFLSIFAACACTMAANAQELIIRIDDMGALHSVNQASIDAYQNGIATSVEVICVGPWFPEAVRMLKENPGLDVGVHLAITSEWENIKWRPLTSCPSLVDENGYFLPMMWPNPAYPGLSVLERVDRISLEEIENEFRAQIELAIKNIPNITHVSGHMMSTAFSKEVNELAKRIAAEYGLICIDSMDSGKTFCYDNIGYTGAKVTSKDKIKSFIKSLESLEKGKKYLFLDHPAYDDSEMAPVWHDGYEDVARDRQGVVDFMTCPKVKKTIDRLGIRLISIGDLRK